MSKELNNLRKACNKQHKASIIKQQVLAMCPRPKSRILWTDDVDYNDDDNDDFDFERPF